MNFGPYYGVMAPNPHVPHQVKGGAMEGSIPGKEAFQAQVRTYNMEQLPVPMSNQEYMQALLEQQERNANQMQTSCKPNYAFPGTPMKLQYPPAVMGYPTHMTAMPMWQAPPNPVYVNGLVQSPTIPTEKRKQRIQKKASSTKPAKPQKAKAIPKNSKTNPPKVSKKVVQSKSGPGASPADLSRNGCANLLLDFSRSATASPKDEASAEEPPKKKRKYARDVPNIPSPVFKKDRLVPFKLGPVPDFIMQELSTTTGTGQFTRSELMITLLFAHQLLSKRNSAVTNGKILPRGNTYAIIKTLMGDKRSRASIRRKIEKIVNKDTGIPGGLLKENGRINVALDSVWNKFVTLLVVAERSGTARQQKFAEKLREFSNNYVESNLKNFRDTGLRVSKLKHPREYTEAETKELLKNINTRETGFNSATK